jgi:hypothetical protein
MQRELFTALSPDRVESVCAARNAFDQVASSKGIDESPRIQNHPNPTVSGNPAAGCQPTPFGGAGRAARSLPADLTHALALTVPPVLAVKSVISSLA